MATDVFDDYRFSSQTTLYEPARTRIPKDTTRHAITESTTTIYETSSTITTTHSQPVKYSSQTSVPTNHVTTNSIQQRNSISNDLISLFRTFAMKPFRTSSMINAVGEGQTNTTISGNHTHGKPPISLLKYRPLSENVSDHTSSTLPTRQTQGFLKRMGWPVHSTTDDARVKWKVAMKFLFPVKFDVDRAINLYRTHETIRKIENLDRIWINSPHLIREIHSNKFFPLPRILNQPLTVCFTASQLNNTISSSSLPSQARELVALQALVCQLDVVTEDFDVQQYGLNFVYDMQTCSASQFDMNLSKKVLKLLQGGYPAMVKNIFIISAPKWFKIAYKVSMFSPDQMREFLINQYNYSLTAIPISLGGLFDPTNDADTRYQTCLSIVTNSQSICHQYYSLDQQSITTKSSSNILFFNTDHHQHQNQDTTVGTPSLVAIVALRRNPDSFNSRIRKRESSSSTDSEKRRRSNGSLIEEEPFPRHSLTYIPQEISFDQSQQRPTAVINENFLAVPQAKVNHDSKNSMSESENREQNTFKRDPKRANNSLYKPLNATEFLSKTNAQIRQEYRKLPNPVAKDTQAAKEERNLDKSRYRDVIPGEATRVKLQPDGDDKNDFINANYVTGHNNQDKAYIFAQGPLESTVKDFWRMIWQENIVIIVMTTNIREKGTMKCFPYWPAEINAAMNTGFYQIQNDHIEKFDSFAITTLTLRKVNSSESRIVYHAHYLKWPDHGIPSNTKDALEFLAQVESYRRVTMTRAPILLHCSAGIGRTGTFCAIDMGIKRYLENKLIDIPSTVLKMRTERAGSVQTEDQYVFAYLALKDYIEQQQQALQERVNDVVKSTDIELIEASEESKLKDTNGLSAIDDNLRKATRLKKHGKKFDELPQVNILPSVYPGKTSHLHEPTSHRGKTLSDSNVSAVQHITPSTTTFQTDSNRQRPATEYSSSVPTTTGSVHHKKARK